MTDRTSPKRHRPSAIDVHFSAHPGQRAIAEQWAADLGVTVDDLLARLVSLGVNTSRSAASRWRVRYQRRPSGRPSDLRAAVAAAVVVADEQQLRAVAGLLGVA